MCEVFNMVGYIYKYENKINGKKYVGQTKKTPKERAGKNFQLYHGKFGNAIKKYGADMFKLEILAKVDLPLPELTEKLNELETYYIHKYDCVNNGYNLCPFGNASKGWSDEMRRKLSNTNKGHLTSAETRAKISKANKGHKTAELTPELSKKLSEAGKKGALAKKGKHYYNNGDKEAFYVDGEQPQGWVKGRKPISDKTREKLSVVNKGKKMSKESINKRTNNRRNNNNGKYHSEAGIQNIIEKNTGKKLSSETIAKRTATRKKNKQMKK
jgi:group I intron endonuclease